MCCGGRRRFEGDFMNSLMCLRVDEATENYIADGSSKFRCSKCTAAVWVSVSGQDLLGRGEAEVVCTACAEKFISEATTEDPVELQVRPEMVREFMGHMLALAEREGVRPGNLCSTLNLMFGKKS